MIAAGTKEQGQVVSDLKDRSKKRSHDEKSEPKGSGDVGPKLNINFNKLSMSKL